MSDNDSDYNMTQQVEDDNDNNSSDSSSSQMDTEDLAHIDSSKPPSKPPNKQLINEFFTPQESVIANASNIVEETPKKKKITSSKQAVDALKKKTKRPSKSKKSEPVKKPDVVKKASSVSKKVSKPHTKVISAAEKDRFMKKITELGKNKTTIRCAHGNDGMHFSSVMEVEDLELRNNIINEMDTALRVVFTYGNIDKLKLKLSDPFPELVSNFGWGTKPTDGDELKKHAGDFIKSFRTIYDILPVAFGIPEVPKNVVAAKYDHDEM